MKKGRVLAHKNKLYFVLKIGSYDIQYNSISLIAVVTCPEINLLNGNATFTGLNYGSTITYDCHDGFTLTGNKTTATCGKDGTWTGTNPQCAGQTT